MPPPDRIPYRIDNVANREVVDEAGAVALLAALAGHDDLRSRGQRVATLRMLGRRWHCGSPIARRTINESPAAARYEPLKPA